MEVQLKRPTPGDASPAQFRPGQEQHVVMMSCKALPGMSMAVKDGAVAFDRTSRTDANQQWVMDYSCGLKDAKGNPAFALVKQPVCLGGTRKAIQNPEKAEQPVRLVPYIPNPLDPLKPDTEGGLKINPDVSLLWTAEDTEGGLKIIHEYKDTEGCLKSIRNLVLAAAHQGLQVVASNYNGGDSRQNWSIQRRIG